MLRIIFHINITHISKKQISSVETIIRMIYNNTLGTLVN